MPTIKGRVTLTAGVNANLLANSQYRQPEFAGRVRLFAVSDASDVVNVQFNSGSNLILENSQIDEMAATEPMGLLQQPLATDVIQPNEQLGLIASSATTGDIVRFEVHIDPLS